MYLERDNGRERAICRLEMDVCKHISLHVYHNDLLSWWSHYWKTHSMVLDRKTRRCQWLHGLLTSTGNSNIECWLMFPQHMEAYLRTVTLPKRFLDYVGKSNLQGFSFYLFLPVTTLDIFLLTFWSCDACASGCLSCQQDKKAKLATKTLLKGLSCYHCTKAWKILKPFSTIFKAKCKICCWAFV